MKPPIYLTDPKEVRKARSTQPRATLPQLLRQEAELRSAAEKFFASSQRDPAQCRMPCSNTPSTKVDG